MFGRIAGVYDLLNHVLSFGIDYGWRRQLAALAVENLPFQSDSGAPLLLDLAAGTLDVALALHVACPQASVLAMDFCAPMLLRGRKKLKRGNRGQAIAICAADALSLPLPDASVNAVTMAFGIRNIPERSAAFAEMRRVLRPGGRACILEFGSASERIWGGIYNVYLARALPRVAALFAGDRAAYEYLARTIKNFPSAPELCLEMDRAGLVNASFRKLSGGIVCLHWAQRESSEQAHAEVQKNGQRQGHATEAAQAIVVKAGGLQHCLARMDGKEREYDALYAQA